MPPASITPGDGTKPNLLLVGLIFDGEIPDNLRAAYGSPAAIERAVKVNEDLAIAAGYGVTSQQLDPAQLEEGLNEFQEYLKSGKYDAVMIGSGVRLNPTLTPLFETMVNMCRRVVPNTPMMFNQEPGSMTNCLERLYGDKFD